MTSAPRHPLPATPYGDDDGSADPRIVAALAAFGRGEGGSAGVLTALAAGRLLVPVVAIPADGAPSDGAPGDHAAARNPSSSTEKRVSAEKNVEMATVLTTGRDGRRGLLAFTCVDSLRRWDPDARPAPVPTRTAAEAALADGADALVIDLAGPVTFSVDARDLRSLAAGWRPLGPWPGVAEADPVHRRAARHRALRRRVPRPLRAVLRRVRQEFVR